MSANQGRSDDRRPTEAGSTARPPPPLDVTVRVDVDGSEVAIHADELHPGDVVDYCGALHHVTRVDRGAGWSWSVASDGTGWAMALSHDVMVLRRRA